MESSIAAFLKRQAACELLPTVGEEGKTVESCQLWGEGKTVDSGPTVGEMLRTLGWWILWRELSG